MERTRRYPEKIIQFGEGNFLRCFIDWQIDILNEKTDFNSGITVIRPIDYDSVPLLDTQDGLYTTVIRGINESGEAVKDYRLIQSVNREIPVYKEFDKVFTDSSGRPSVFLRVLRDEITPSNVDSLINSVTTALL